MFKSDIDLIIIIIGLLTTANAAGTNALKCLARRGGALNNKIWSPLLVTHPMNPMGDQSDSRGLSSSSFNNSPKLKRLIT
jgi:hypothetical protein